MKKLIAFLCLLFSLAASAQITFTRTDYGANGDRILYAVDSPVYSAINFGSNGANHNWNFLKANYLKRYDSTLFFSVTSDPNAPGVTANLMLRSVAGAEQYQEVTNNFVKVIIDMPAYKVSGVKLKLFNFPLTYQSSSVDSANATTRGLLSDFGIAPITGIDSLRIDAKIYMYTDCDGWGKLTIPDSSVYDALHLTNTIIINANIYAHTIFGWGFISSRSQTNKSYLWFAPNSKSYIANVTLDTLGNISSFSYKVNYVPQNIVSKLISITPDSAQQGERLNVTVHGRNTYFNHGNVNITIGSCTIDSIQVINDSTLTVTIHSQLSTSTGWYYMQVNDPVAGWLYLNNAFKITASPLAPKLISVSPAFGYGGQTMEVVIQCIRTHFMKGSNYVYFNPVTAAKGSIYVNSFSVINDSTITCKILIDSAISGTAFNVRVYNSTDGNIYLNSSFTVVNTGIKETNETLSEVLIFPNPANDRLTISFAMLSSPVTIQLLDVCGRELRSLITSENNISIDVSDLHSGIYFYAIKGKDFSVTRKIVISK